MRDWAPTFKFLLPWIIRFCGIWESWFFCICFHADWSEKMSLHYKDLKGSIKITLVWRLPFRRECTSPERLNSRWSHGWNPGLLILSEYGFHNGCVVLCKWSPSPPAVKARTLGVTLAFLLTPHLNTAIESFRFCLNVSWLSPPLILFVS